MCISNNNITYKHVIWKRKGQVKMLFWGIFLYFYCEKKIVYLIKIRKNISIVFLTHAVVNTVHHLYSQKKVSLDFLMGTS